MWLQPKKRLKNIVAKLHTEPDMAAHTALANAIITDKTKIPTPTKEKLDVIVGKYL